MAVLSEFAAMASTNGLECAILDAPHSCRHNASIRAEGLVGSLWSAHELQVNPRQVSLLLRQWLAECLGVRFEFTVHA